MHTLTGQVIRKPIGQRVFAYNEDFPLGTQVFATTSVIMIYHGQHITSQDAALR